MAVNKIVIKVDGTQTQAIDFQSAISGLGAGAHTITVEGYNGATLVHSQTKNVTVAGTSSYETETTAFMNNAGIPNDGSATVHTGISGTQLWTIMDNYIKGLKTNGLFAKGIMDYPFIGGTATTSGVNIFNPTGVKLTWFGSWVHNEFGAKGNGANTYAKTGIIPSTTSLTTTSGGIFIVSGTNNTTDKNDVFEFGSQTTQSVSLIMTVKRSNGGSGANGNIAKIYGNEPAASNYYNALGIHSVNRKGADPQMWRNGVKEGTPFISSGSVPSLESYIGTINLGDAPYVNGYSNQRLQGIILNNGLTDAELVAWNNLINDRELALGRKTW